MTSPLSKPCLHCGKIFYKKQSCSKKAWAERTKFCSRQCKAEHMRGKPGRRLGKGGGLGSQGGAIHPCRICGGPTKYPLNKNLLGKIHCGGPACAEKSREIKNERLRKTARKRGAYNPKGGWDHVNQSPDVENQFKEWFEGMGFIHQYVYKTGNASKYYKLDFAHPEMKIDVEFDGSIHDRPDRKEHDEIRDDFFSGLGWVIVRIRNEDAKKNPDQIKEKILKMIGV